MTAYHSFDARKICASAQNAEGLLAHGFQPGLGIAHIAFLQGFVRALQVSCEKVVHRAAIAFVLSVFAHKLRQHLTRLRQFGVEILRDQRLSALYYLLRAAAVGLQVSRPHQ